jgi:hypothetical protein
LKALLAILLTLSVGLNVFLWLRKPQPAPARPHVPVERETHAEPRAEPPRFLGLPQRRETPPAQPTSAPRTSAPVMAVDENVQQDVLCTLAEQDLRRNINKDRDDVIAALRKSFAKADKQDADAREEGEKQAATIGLSGDAEERYLAAYREKRLARIASARSAIDGDPPDYQGLMNAAIGLYADEDALAQRFGGDAGRDRLRAAELEGRVSILAIVAAYADVPFASLKF